MLCRFNSRGRNSRGVMQPELSGAGIQCETIPLFIFGSIHKLRKDWRGILESGYGQWTRSLGVMIMMDVRLARSEQVGFRPGYRPAGLGRGPGNFSECHGGRRAAGARSPSAARSGSPATVSASADSDFKSIRVRGSHGSRSRLP